jgi:DNA-directed RNA polymerase sigma subunit (sigma70/sigma32)
MKKLFDFISKCNLKFAISIAKEYQGQGLLLSDLISEGNYGEAAHENDRRLQTESSHGSMTG